MTDEELNAVREQLLADPNLQLSIIGTLVDALTAARRERDEALAAHKRILNEAVEYSHDRAVEVERLTRERDEALAKYQFMVDRAINEKLDGYRELAARAADAENLRDKALRAASAQVEENEHLRARIAAAEQRGRAAERADVVAWLANADVVTFDTRAVGGDNDPCAYLTLDKARQDIEAGRHVGAGKGE